MLQFRLIALLTAVFLFWALPLVTIAAEPSSPEIEQIDGNYQSTYQAGNNNQTTIEQWAVASGLASPGSNISIVTQEGDDNQTGIHQDGNALEATVGQNGNANTVNVEQSGVGLAAKIEQSGNTHEVKVFQTGEGSGVPISVQQY